MSIEAVDQTGLPQTYASRVRADLDRVDSEIAELKARLESLSRDRTFLSRLLDNIHEEEDRSVSAVRIAAQPTHEPAASPSAERAPRGAVKAAVRALLSERQGPMSVTEVCDALHDAGSGKPAGKVVVRNTLESLVAKGLAHRSREGGSVWYTCTGLDTADRSPS